MSLKFVTCSGLALLLFCAFACTRHEQKVESKRTIKISIVDSLRMAMNTTDSIRVIKVGGNSVAFIDYNKTSTFHEKLREVRGNNIELDSYNEAYYRQLKAVHLPLPDEIITKWYRLNEFDQELYVYMDCEYQMVYQTTDSTFNSYPMDGASPIALSGYRRMGNVNQLFTYEGDTIEIKKLDDRPVFQIKHGNECGLYTSREGMNSFNIIVHACEDETDDIVEFTSRECQ